ncbi:hypothetical protein [Marinobacter mobilis]|uniref:hypothetical protein n=1 Tax=Marinobacter mobilis TaxID=488533 RepID=UPI0035C77E46
MRVKSFPGARFCVVTLIFLAFGATTGCKTKKPADDPSIIGIPPATAYLGVEYYYNFGADGGEGILNYSLSNAPSWLALEDTQNKARQGIIMRGVPGITGGRRGGADLGETKDITLLTTDGSRVGVQPFNITVETNDLALTGADIVEGTADTDSYKSADDSSCALPVMTGPGEHTYTVNEYDENGDFVATAERTSPTEPVIIRISLDQPSVTPAQVAFELRSEFDPNVCEEGSVVTPPHQKCEYGPQNQTRAILGQDIVGWGNGSAGDLPVPDYLVYQLDDAGEFYTSGVITLEPGITECYIRLEVIDDGIAEDPEVFTLALTDVREGMVSFGNGEEELVFGSEIRDDEPSASLETELGLTRDVVNIAPVLPASPADSPQYVVRLDGERDGTFRVRLGSTATSSAIVGLDYEIQVPGDGDTWEAGNELSFPEGIDEAYFRVVALGSFTNALNNDKFADIVIDESYQAGREGYAGSAGTVLHVGINELTSGLIVGSEPDFVPTDMAVGHDGHIFVAGYVPATRQAEVRVWDRVGNPAFGPVVLPSVTVAEGNEPVLAYAEKFEGADEWSRRLAISWGTDDALTGASNSGGSDLVTVLLKFDSAAVPEAYVPVWEIQSGTSGDDSPVWVGLDSKYTVFVSGETSGIWSGQTGAGGVDSFVQRIDDQEEGGGLVPSVAWTRQAGSGLDDAVVGGGLTSEGAMAAGNTSGGVNGETQLGLKDFFFYTASARDGNLNINQRGTEADDPLAASVVGDNLIWLLGNSQGRYFAQPVVNADGEETAAKELGRETTASQAGYLLRYSLGGVFTGAESLNDVDDVSTETFTEIERFDQAIVVGGFTDGDFIAGGGNPGAERQPVLVGIKETLATTGGESAELWRVQPVQPNSRIVGLANYRNDEITALFEQGSVGSREWGVVLFSGDGRQLNRFTP